MSQVIICTRCSQVVGEYEGLSFLGNEAFYIPAEDTPCNHITQVTEKLTFNGKIIQKTIFYPETQTESVCEYWNGEKSLWKLQLFMWFHKRNSLCIEGFGWVFRDGFSFFGDGLKFFEK